MSFDLGNIGTMLKAAREEKQLTLQQVAEALFMRKRIIEAIETGRWDDLPHEVYVKGYVTQYAAFLAIDSSIKAKLASPAGEPASEKAELGTISRHYDNVHRTPRRRLAGIVVVAMIAGAFVVYQNMDRRTYVAHPVVQQAHAVIPPVQQPTYTPAVPQVNYATVAANVYADDHQEAKAAIEAKKLTIACQQRTWVRIVIDGLEKKEFMMNPEEVLVLDGKEGFDLLIGNAGGIKLFYNGKDTGFAGGEGEVKRLSLS